MKETEFIEKFNAIFGGLEDVFRDVVTRARARMQPPDFSRTKDEDLLVLLVVLRAVARERIIKIIDEPDLDWMEVHERALSIVDILDDPRTLATLYFYRLDFFLASTRNFDLLYSLIRLDLHCAYTFREIKNRIKQRPDYSVSKLAGNLLLEGKSEEKIFLILLNSVRVGYGRAKKRINDLETYRPTKEDSSDLQSVAKLGAWEFWQGVKAEIYEEMEPITIPTSLPKDRNQLWKVLGPSLLQLEAEPWAEVFLPILRGSLDRWPDKVQQALRNHNNKWEAQKRQHNGEWSYTEGGEDKDSTTYEPPLKRVKNVGDLPAGGEDFEPRKPPPPKTQEAQKIVADWVARERMEEQIRQVIRLAEERFGYKAAKAFECRKRVDTDKEAAKLAGISERMFRNYRAEIKKIFANKKTPSKSGNTD